MKIKICGLNPARDVQLCIDLKINYLGFIFYKKSPRNVNLQDIKALSSYQKKRSAFVAVTVNPSDEFIKRNILGNFDFIQLHGSESKDRVADIKRMGLKVIKAIKVKEEKDIDKHKEFDNADIILFDTPGMEKSLEFPKNLITKLPLVKNML
jgi:phosphoribosylanthranilate isomerase